MKATTLWWAALAALSLLAQAALGAPFFPDDQRDDADAEARTHGLHRRKKMRKQQLLCSLLSGASQPQGRTFDLLGLGGSGGGGGGQPCHSYQGGGYPAKPPVSPGGFPGAGSFPGGGGFPGGLPGGLPGGSGINPPSGGVLSPVGGLLGGLLNEQQEILSSVVGLVGAVSNAGSGVVSGVLSGVRPQRYLRPIYRTFRPYYRLF